MGVWLTGVEEWRFGVRDLAKVRKKQGVGVGGLANRRKKRGVGVVFW